MGLSYQYQESILRPEWADRSREIKERDNYTCQKCYKKTGGLHVHHKYYVFGRQPWEYPDQALVTLCNYCHSEEHYSKVPNYQESDLALLKIEAPNIYERELVRRRNEETKRELERKENERLRQEKKEERKWTIVTIFLLPIILPVILLLFLGRVFAITIGSFGAGGVIFWLLTRQGFPEWLGIIGAFGMGVYVYRELNKFIPKSPLDFD